MARYPKDLEASEARLAKLAASIDALVHKDEEFLRRAHEIAGLRRTAASELHRICTDFVFSVNRLLSRSLVVLDPSDLSDGSFLEDRANLFQINIQGRILQLEFESTPELLSTEEFRIPYTLAGSIRAFNQEMLDKTLIEEQFIFYTVAKNGNMWRFLDARTYRSGPVDKDYLTFLVEQLV